MWRFRDNIHTIIATNITQCVHTPDQSSHDTIFCRINFLCMIRDPIGILLYKLHQTLSILLHFPITSILTGIVDQSNHLNHAELRHKTLLRGIISWVGNYPHKNMSFHGLKIIRTTTCHFIFLFKSINKSNISHQDSHDSSCVITSLEDIIVLMVPQWQYKFKTMMLQDYCVPWYKLSLKL